MNFLHEIVDQGRRVAVDALNGSSIENSSPWSPDVPEDLREWLPDLFDRFPIVFPWSKPQPIDPALHTVWILDNAAFHTPAPGDRRPDLAELEDPNHTQPKLTENGGTQKVQGGSGWEVEYVACYFIKNSGKDIAGKVAILAHHLSVSDDDVATKQRIAARLQPFIDTVLPNHTMRISIAGKEEQTLGPSSHSGISSGLHELHTSPTPNDTAIESHAINLPPPFNLPSTTTFAAERGWSIISDIDDTIKITQSPNPIGILQNTFTVDDPLPVDGMPELYSQLQTLLNQPPFFYLSASPYNLYPFLRRFRDRHFPHGMMILRDASWQNLAGLISSLQNSTQEYKVDRLKKIHSWFPHRKFVCLGDSTQTDPEAYGEVARKFPGWVGAIFVRKVTGIAGMDEKKNEDERFEKAFRGLDRGLWHVFTEPEEVRERVEQLVRDEGDGQ